jgi:hypothetical protein
MRLHEWAFKTASWRRQQGLEGSERSPDSDVIDDVFDGVGAYIMGPVLEPIKVVSSPAVTHIKYRVGR